MTMVTAGVIRDIYFGFDAQRLMLRVDTAGRAKDDLAAADELHVRFLQPADVEARVTGLRDRNPAAALYRQEQPVPEARVEVAVDQILEMTVPFAPLGLKPEEPIRMFLDVITKKRSTERAPQEGVLELNTPSPDFELEMWQV